MARKTTKNKKRKTTVKKTKPKNIWKKQGEEFVDAKTAREFANRINKSSNKQARLKKIGRGRTRITVNGKGYLGKYNKNGTVTLNTFIVETKNKKM
jgi:hypothetical protein